MHFGTLKTKSLFVLRIGLSSIPKLLSKFHPPPEFAPLYQKNNIMTTLIGAFFVPLEMHGAESREHGVTS